MEGGWYNDEAHAWIEVQKLFRQVDAVAYVLAQGGEVFTQPAIRLDAATLTQLAVAVPLLPGPNRAIYQLAQAGLQRFPSLEHHLLCQTAFFANLPDAARYYPLPYEVSEGGYRRFGGDGLAHAWAWRQASHHQKDVHKLVSVHIGAIPSVAAILDGQPVETSQGYSPVEGLPGETTSGDVDPGVVLLLAENGMSPADLERTLTRESGFSALAGKPRSPFDIACDPTESLERQLLLNSLVKAIGSSAASLGGLDGLIFSAAAVSPMRILLQEICVRLVFAGMNPKAIALSGTTAWELSGPHSAIQATAFDYHLFDGVENAIEEWM
jgi:acetate kinase